MLLAHTFEGAVAVKATAPPRLIVDRLSFDDDQQCQHNQQQGAGGDEQAIEVGADEAVLVGAVEGDRTRDRARLPASDCPGRRRGAGERLPDDRRDGRRVFDDDWLDHPAADGPGFDRPELRPVRLALLTFSAPPAG